MPEALLLLIVVLVLAVVFDFINGFHDTANAIATVVATRVLTPMQAVLMAAVLNFVGALTGTAVAKTISSGLVPAELATQHAVVAALLSAIIWNLITWYYGIPSSSSHALIGGIIGAAIAQAGFAAPLWPAIIEKVILPLIFSPIIGFVFAMILILLLLRLFLHRAPAEVRRFFGRAQLVSSAFMAFSHGGNDAQKTMGVMTLALASYLNTPNMDIPLWVKVVAGLAMAMGTAMGGWRIIKTMGTRLAKIDSVHGFAAETSAATVIEVASRLGFPLSTTHVISSAIMGVGAARSFSAVRWTIAGNIVTAWILTIPTCMIIAGLIYTLIRLFFLH